MIHAAAQLSRRLPALAEVRTDGELLAAFLATRDEPAFAELVRRHGPLVWGACRRLLPDPADAEDAFQAAFLVLVRSARRLTGRPTLGPWLYKVAGWTARNARRRNARTLARRVPLSPVAADPSPGPGAADLRADLDTALLALPEKYRTPLILCHLQGWSRRDAAVRLGCPEGTLSSLLSRGLARLRTKLPAHDPAKALAVAGAAVPSVLVSATVRAATASRLATAGVVSASASQLAEGVLRMLWVKKATAATFGLVVVFGLGLGAGVSVREVPGAIAGDEPGGGAAAPPAPADLAAIKAKLEDARKALLKTELTILSLQSEIDIARQNMAFIAEHVKEGTARPADVLDIQDRLTDFKERVARAEKDRAKLLAEIQALEAQLKVAQPAPPKPAPPLPEDIEKKLRELEREMKRRAQEYEAHRVEFEKQARMYDELRKKAPGLLNPKAKPYLEVSLGAKDAAWLFTVKEFDADGKAVGTVAFENGEVFRRFLARTAKDVAGPKEVRIVAHAGGSLKPLLAALDACKAVGLMVKVVPDDDARAKELNRLYEDLLLQRKVDEVRELQKQLEDARKKQKEAEQVPPPGK